MKNTTKRILAIVCAAMMILGLAIVPASAEGTDKVLVISPGSGSSNWDYLLLSNASATASTAVTEYTMSTRFKLDNYTGNGSGYGRPVALKFGANAYLALNVQSGGAIKLYDTTTTNWGGSAAPAGDTLLTTVLQNEWVDVTAHVYTDAGVVKVDWTINGETTTLASRLNSTAVGAVATRGAYFFVDPGICATSGTWVVDWDLSLDYVNADFGAFSLDDDFNEIAANPAEAVSMITTSNDSYWTCGKDGVQGTLGETGKFALKVVDDDTEVEEVDTVDKTLTISRVSGTGAWAGVSLGNPLVTATTTLANGYTLDVRFKIENANMTDQRPMLFKSGDDELAVVITNDGKIKYYMTNGFDWGGPYPAQSKLDGGITVSDLLATGEQGKWQNIQFKVYQSGADVLCDMTINGTTVTGLDHGVKNSYGSTYRATAPVPVFHGLCNQGGYFEMLYPYTPSGDTWDVVLDYVNLNFEGAHTSLQNDFKDVTVASNGAVPTQANGNTWYLGSTFGTAVAEDLSGQMYDVTLASDGNGFVQVDAEDPHTDAEAFEFEYGTSKTVYTWPKAGYTVAGYSVDGGDNVPVVVGNDGSFVLSGITADCDIVVNFAAIETSATPTLTYVQSDNSKAVKFNTSAGNFGRLMLNVAGASGTVDEYTLSYRLKIDNLSSVLPGAGVRPWGIKHGNNTLYFKEDGAGNFAFYLGTGEGGTANEEAGATNLNYSVPADSWFAVELYVHVVDGVTVTDVKINGTTVATNLAVGSGAPALTEPYGSVFRMRNCYGTVASGSDAHFYRPYDILLDYLNVSFTKGGVTTNLASNFDSATMDDLGLVSLNTNGAYYVSDIVYANLTNLANGVFGTVNEGGYNGVSALTKIGFGLASDFGIIISETALTGDMTLEDLADYKVNTGGSSAATAFPAYAYGSDGRFAVKVLDGPESENYFAGKTVYVYVYAANANGVVYAPVNADGFLFN